YENERKLRVAVIHGMARMAALMASTYKAYLGVGLGPLEFLTNFRIPHPGRVGGRFFVDILMPSMLNWILGGNRQTDNCADGLKMMMHLSVLLMESMSLT
ncbi:zeaxanthin epoxidase chloroplastic-like, partial [Trifolium medium]|nr:zeaxanthin epoxidase chloroplastic-like [Trifolium medium]